MGEYPLSTLETGITPVTSDLPYMQPGVDGLTRGILAQIEYAAEWVEGRINPSDCRCDKGYCEEHSAANRLRLIEHYARHLIHHFEKSRKEQK